VTNLRVLEKRKRGNTKGVAVNEHGRVLAMRTAGDIGDDGDLALPPSHKALRTCGRIAAGDDNCVCCNLRGGATHQGDRAVTRMTIRDVKIQKRPGVARKDSRLRRPPAKDDLAKDGLMVDDRDAK
jgi:hypothetical protein